MRPARRSTSAAVCAAFALLAASVAAASPFDVVGPLESALAEPEADETPPPRPPGLLDIDPRVAERALERTLTAEGALLVPSGQAEIEPFVAYGRSERGTATPVRVIDPDTGAPTLVTLRTERSRHELSAGLAARVGLPHDAQLELSLPYHVTRRSDTDEIAFAPLGREARTVTGIGDLRVGLAKTLLREHGPVPDLVARATWTAGTGRRGADDIGGGHHRLRGALTALKRQDPLAFVVGGYYETVFARGGVEPGERFGFSAGATLAASPETSLGVALVHDFALKTRLSGQSVAGSDRHAAALALGASSILGRGALLSISVLVGLTRDAPDYAVHLSLPIRFDLAPHRPVEAAPSPSPLPVVRRRHGPAEDPILGPTGPPLTARRLPRE